MRNVCYQLLGHLVQDIDNGFDKYVSIVYLIKNVNILDLMYGLAPSVKAERNITVKPLIEQYKEDLPRPVDPERELFRWKRRWESVSRSYRPSTIVLSLNVCRYDMYANLHTLLRSLLQF